MNENPEPEPEAPTRPAKARRKPRIITVVALLSVTIVGIVAVYFIFRAGESGRPVPAPRSVTFSEMPDRTASGDQTLTLTPEQIQGAQLKIETVGERPSVEAASQMTTGIVQANTYRETPVISLVGGIVRSVNAELGQSVRRGQQVAMVFSNELAEAQSKYLASVTVLDEHHRHHQRAEQLAEIGAVSRQDLEMAASEYREAEANVTNLREKLLLLGMSRQRVNALESMSQVSSEVIVSSPSSGTITSRSVNPGEVIEANKELMRVTDLSNVWVVGQVFEKDLARIHTGSGASITSDTYPNRTFRGRVSYIDPMIDQATHTAQLRIELPNPGQMFKIGMYVNVGFDTLGPVDKTQPVIPKAAVQTIGNRQFVFVATPEPLEFILRPVHIGAEVEGFVQVIDGLDSTDRIVTQGSFLLRAEWLKTHPNFLQ